jgi:hypothetical protein
MGVFAGSVGFGKLAGLCNVEKLGRKAEIHGWYFSGGKVVLYILQVCQLSACRNVAKCNFVG